MIPLAARRLFAAGLLLLFGACCGPFESDSTVEFRLRNDSQYELQDVVVGFPDGNEVYGTLAPGEVTSYRAVRRAYRYAYVEAVVEGNRVVQQPIDYVGEEYVEPGSYTWVIRVDSPGNQFGLSTTLVRD